MLEGWRREELDDHIDLVTGFPFKSAEYTSADGIRLLRGDNVVQNNIRWEDACYWPKDRIEGLSAYELRSGDVVIALDRTWVKAGLKAASISNADLPCLLVQRVARLRAKDSMDQSFLSQIIQSYRFEQMAKSNKTETAVPHISPNDIRDFIVDLPTLPEQRKIAEILRAWDDAIDACQSLTERLKQRFSGTARRFFDPCHPTFDCRPNSWIEVTLGDVFTERTESGGVGDRLLSITMGDGIIDREEVGRKDTSTDDKSSYKLILPGDIGYNTMRMWQGVCGLSTLRGIVSPAYTIVTPDNVNISARYAAHLFKSPRMVFDFERFSQGLTSDTWNLKFPAFSKIKVFLPPIDVQHQQAELLDVLKGEIEVLHRKLEALANQKRGLMQKLLTGEWRVNLGEVAA